MTRLAPGRSRDYHRMLDAYSSAKGDPSVFADSRVANLVVHENQVLGSHLVPGLEVIPKETGSGIDLALRVMPGAMIEHPVHLCFGVLPAEGVQEINIDAEVGDSASVNLLAHCIFPSALKVEHRMQARVAVGRNGVYGYDEVHFHGEEGGAVVLPRARIELDEGACLRTGFQLTQGRVGSLDIDYEVKVAAGAVGELVARVYGRADDRVAIRERCELAGEDARGLIKSRVAVSGNAESEVISEMSAAGAHARGHVDCIEIVQDRGRARAVPIVDVIEHTAKVTHEAAIGSVDRKQLETLMARGLKRQDAVDVLIGGLLGKTGSSAG